MSDVAEGDPDDGGPRVTMMDKPMPSTPVVLSAEAIGELALLSLGDLEGVRHRVLWSDESSMAGVMQVDAGHHLGEHSHRRHHHHVWILEGGARVLGEDLVSGSYVHIPDGVAHDIDATSSKGCTFLYLYLDQGRDAAPEGSP